MYERKFTTELWQYPGHAAWYFMTLPLEVGDEIRLLSSGGIRRGFGSVRVTAQIGLTQWQTSVFPDKNSGSYLLPIKKQVRTVEKLSAGDKPSVLLGLDS